MRQNAITPFPLLLECALLFLCAQPVLPQRVLRGASPDTSPVLPQHLVAAFEAAEPLTSLTCAAKPAKPILGFDLRFHSGYLVEMPIKDLIGPGNSLSILVRVTPSAAPGHSTFFEDRFVVPEVVSASEGMIGLPGKFDLGTGSYHVDLLVFDKLERFCSFSWDITASVPAKDKALRVALADGEVQAARGDPFTSESEVAAAAKGSLRVKVLANFVPRTPSSPAIDPADLEVLLSMIRNISSDPHVKTVTLVAFNLYESKIVFRQDEVNRIDFPALGQSLQNMAPGTVDVNQLKRKNGSTHFLAELVRDETSKNGHPDALVFIGPKAYVDGNIQADEVSLPRDASCPVFYLNYVSDPEVNPWRDSIGRVVKTLHGAEFSILGPRDLWNAVGEVVARSFAQR